MQRFQDCADLRRLSYAEMHLSDSRRLNRAHVRGIDPTARQDSDAPTRVPHEPFDLRATLGGGLRAT